MDTSEYSAIVSQSLCFKLGVEITKKQQMSMMELINFIRDDFRKEQLDHMCKKHGHENATLFEEIIKGMTDSFLHEMIMHKGREIMSRTCNGCGFEFV